MAKTYAFFALLSAGLMLAACAGTPPQNPSGTPTASVSTPTPSAAAASSSGTKLPKGYRRVSRNGQDFICHRETSTNSRAEINETCMTAAEFEERASKGQDFLQDLQNKTLPVNTGNKAFTPGF